MTARSFFVLVVLTVIMVIAAAGILIRADRPETISGSETPVFPDLLQRIDDLAAIRIENSDGTMTIEASDDGWGLTERNGYPVSIDKIKEMVVSLARLTKLEPKTAQPEHYARLGVEGVDEDGASSQLVMLQNGEGGELAKLIVGKPAYGLGEDGGVYVRHPDEARAWAARGRLTVGRTPGDWLIREVIDIPVKDIARLTITQSDGEVLTIKRAEGDTFILEERLEGAVLRQANDLRSMASAMSDLSLSDVRAADNVQFAEDNVLRARFVTTDGLAVNLVSAEIDGETWIKLSADVPKDTAGDLVGESPATARAQELNDQWRDWVYSVPDWKIKPLRRGLAELIDSAPSTN